VTARSWFVYAQVLAFAVVALLPAFVMTGSRYFSTLVFAACFATVAISLDILLGFAGQLALGQTALFAVGAYTSAILTTTYDWRPDVAMLAAVAAGVAVALATSPILRLRGFYFALATLVLVMIAHDILTSWIKVTGGASGFVGIGPFSIFGVTLRTQRAYYLFAYVVLLLAIVAGLHMRRSRFGRSLLAIHHDQTAAEALGISVFWTKMRVWVVAAAFASLAGVVYAHYVQFVSPAQFGLEPAIKVLAAAVIGGTGTIFGPVLGVAVLWLIPEVFHGLQEYVTLVYGAAVIVFMIFMPRGLAGAAADLAASLRGRTPPPRIGLETGEEPA
jgi:branched-chain amino acid transport system permease protein